MKIVSGINTKAAIKNALASPNFSPIKPTAGKMVTINILKHKESKDNIVIKNEISLTNLNIDL
ncbi:hypothetical protein [Clostridium pasteurianum]|uniref:Uncharacterized protein n=1 Tax=Clostridium pasteurianum BC1 TaxID=86416 RepID=R4K7F9_CLOPA|nr:hypothetical protein [Clostridium pasteurianum]AGK99112.1 hypothetical protein Clopa_4400 [Clostridium pasteurianum BC1]